MRHRNTSNRSVPWYTALAVVSAFCWASGGTTSATAADLLPTGDLDGGGPRIVNGTLTSQYPSTGALLAPGNPATAGLTCSGTLIGCETFLTAAHCVCDFPGSDCQSGGFAEPNPSDYVVFLQHAGFFAVSSISVRPDFDFPVGDVAVLKLATPVAGIAPSPIDVMRVPAFGTAGTIVGFGREAGGSDYGLKRAGAVTTAPCIDESNVTSVCWDFTEPIGPPGDDSNTCNGDSGGPLFVDFGCGDTVAGVTSGGSSFTCNATDHSYDANVFPYRSFIQTEGGADLANASCGVMPQAGEPSTGIFTASGVLDLQTSQGTHTVNVPAGTTLLRIAMNASEAAGADFDLYVKAGSPPSTSSFDCKGDGPNQYAFCEFASPVPGTWHVLVQRFSGGPATYQLTATTFASGPPGPGTNGQPCDDENACSENDTCQGGACGGTPAANGSACDDGRRCTSPDVCQAGTCTSTAAPVVGCKQPVVSGKASVTLAQRAFMPTRNRLVWRWVKGAATTPADIGDPITSSEYEFCVFDETGGTPALVLEAAVPPGPAWAATSRGFKFKDRTLVNAGISQIKLRTGIAGTASISVLGKGENLAVPSLPLAQDPRVIVQLLTDNACWEARYGTNRQNTFDKFKAKAD
jgi:hypothetical protein